MVRLHFFQIGRGEGGDVLSKEEVFLLGCELEEAPQVDRVRITCEHRGLTIDRAKKRSAKHRKFGEQRADLERIILVERGMIGVCHR